VFEVTDTEVDVLEAAGVHVDADKVNVGATGAAPA